MRLPYPLGRKRGHLALSSDWHRGPPFGRRYAIACVNKASHTGAVPPLEAVTTRLSLTG